MIGLTLTAAKANFLDRAKVIQKVGAAKARVLARQAGFVRVTARRKLRKRKGPSPAGEPPHSHGRHLLRNGILFAVEPSAGIAVVGPVLSTGRGMGEAPGLHEHGGRVVRKGRFVKGRFQTGRGNVTRTVVYPPRPYMLPSLETAQDRLAEEWRDQVRA